MAEPDHDRKRKALSDIYSQHHRAGGRIGFTFGGPERAKQFTQWIGTGKDILDLGCRDGTLTLHFAEGNHVTGVDVDKEALQLCEQNLGIETRWADVGSGLPFDDRCITNERERRMARAVIRPGVVLGCGTHVVRVGNPEI